MDRGKKGFILHHSPFPVKNRLALTTGNPEGIGKFIAKKALERLGPKKNFQFLVWTETYSKTLKISSFQTVVFKTSYQALKSPFKENYILQIKSPGGPGGHLKDIAKLCLNSQISALITGPVSKTVMKKQKDKALSQTAFLKTLCDTKNVFMCFRGALFNCILLTDHQPLKEIFVDKKKLKKLLALALKARKLLKPSLQKKPLGVLGLNPHAGEEGLIGREEEEILKPLIKTFSPKEVQGPLVPDAAFLKKNWKLYSFFIALHHDQGLIPFKMIHSHRGFAQSLGLPFLRLGVDHGTGIGLNPRKISSESFFSALTEAIRLIKLSRQKALSLN